MDIHSLDEWVRLALSLVPLLNWLTIIAGALIIARHMASAETQLAENRRGLTELHALINSRFDKLLTDSERVAHAAGRLEGIAEGLAEERTRHHLPP